jgi:hypothetical protein
MTFVVTMRFEGDPKRAHAVLRDNPDLYEAIHEGIYRYGLIRCERFVGEGEFFDVDYWPSEAERVAFVEAHGPELKRWNELMGFTAAEVRTWTVAEDGEEF